MADRLVTVATFDSVPQAHLARHELTAAGIRAVLIDEETVGLLWHAAHAFGGVKVQVNEADAERAVEVLTARFGEDPNEAGDERSLEEQALAVPPEEDEPPAGPTPPAAESAEAAPAGGYREDCARRLFFVGWLGGIFPPLIFYALYLMLNAVLGSGELSPRGRLNAVVGSLVTLAFLSVFWLFAGGCCFY